MSVTVQAGGIAADYANPNLPLTVLAKHKVQAVWRYIDGTVAGGKPSAKCATRGELARLSKAGIGCALVFEKWATRCLEGALAGTIDGRQAAADAKTLGYPAGQQILVAFDTDITAANITKALNYWRAFVDACVGYQCGAYADWDMLDAVAKLEPKYRGVGHVQPNAAGWSWDWVKRKWRGTHPSASFQQQPQVDGIDLDVCVKAFTFWTQPAPTPPPLPIFNPALGQWGLWPVNPHKPIITTGANGDAVRYLQGVLKKAGYYTGPIDGSFGAVTATATDHFQASHGLHVDHIVGPQTWPVIDKVA